MRNYLGVFIFYPAKRQLHIRLTGRNPHITEPDVFQLKTIVAFNLYAVRAAGFLCRKLYRPATIFCCRGALLFGETHGDFFTFIGPAPQGNCLITLQNCTVAYQAWQADIGSSMLMNKSQG